MLYGIRVIMMQKIMIRGDGKYIDNDNFADDAD